MGAIAGFMAPFLDYLRPTKSPYLVIQFVAVLVTCYKVTSGDPSAADLDIPKFFIPIFLLVCAIVPLSFIRRDHPAQGDLSQPTEAESQVINSKFENDLDSVFKFSRALCLASAVVMLFVYFRKPSVDNWYAVIAYVMIIVQMGTFLLYTAVRHFKGEDIYNVNLFQIACITAVFFVGAAYLGTQIEGTEPAIRYMYYCKSKKLEVNDAKALPIVTNCDMASTSDLKISRVVLSYSVDYRQASFALFAACWIVYEVFWLKILAGMMIAVKRQRIPKFAQRTTK